ncbi:unnamed protein product, partial [Nesidiocoris tenuis]
MRILNPSARIGSDGLIIVKVLLCFSYSTLSCILAHLGQKHFPFPNHPGLQISKQ